MAWYDPAAAHQEPQRTYPGSPPLGSYPGQGPRPWYAFAGPQTSQGWGSSGMANLTPEQRILYTSADGRSLVDRQLGNWLAPNKASPFHQYIDAMAPKMQQDYAIASAKDPQLQYIDYQQQHYGDLITGFGGLSASQRGENPLAFGGGIAGRNVFR